MQHISSFEPFFYAAVCTCKTVLQFASNNIRVVGQWVASIACALGKFVESATLSRRDYDSQKPRRFWLRLHQRCRAAWQSAQHKLRTNSARQQCTTKSKASKAPYPSEESAARSSILRQRCKVALLLRGMLQLKLAVSYPSTRLLRQHLIQTKASLSVRWMSRIWHQHNSLLSAGTLVE